MLGRFFGFKSGNGMYVGAEFSPGIRESGISIHGGLLGPRGPVLLLFNCSAFVLKGESDPNL